MSEHQRIRPLSPKREEKFRKVVSQRQFNLTVILENVHDPHNIGAVMRTCDAVGVKEVFILYTDILLKGENIAVGAKASSGAKKWVAVHLFNDTEACFKAVKSKYDLILSTHLAEDAKSLHQLDLTQSVALLFGNEHAGISPAALAYSDGNFIIPQMGMVQSLNISVACAVTLYEALRQRNEKGLYGENNPSTPAERAVLFEAYYDLHEQKLIHKKESSK